MKTIRLGVLTTVVFLFFAAISPSTAKAQCTDAVVTGTYPTITVNFLGSVGNQLVFEIVLEQPETAKAVLRIRDEAGTVMYSEPVSNKKCIKKIRVSRDDFEKIEFAYTTNRGDVKKAFEISVQFKESIEVKDITRL